MIDFRKLLLTLSLFICTPAGATVELHAHLFMNEGMTWGFSGKFNDKLSAEDWTDKLSSQANPSSVNASGIRILVVSLYSHPLFVLSLRNSVLSQIELAEKFVKENPEWIIAKSAAQARKAYESGKRILVLALEGASGVIETDEDMRTFVEEKGVRIVTLLHLTNDHLGGVAFLRGFKVLTEPFGWISTLFSGTNEDGVKVNPKGLTKKGRALVRKFIEKKVWVDVAHASDAVQKDLIPMLIAGGQPLLYTHTILRRHHKAERALSDRQLQQVYNTGGIVGIMPSESMLDGTKIDTSLCPSKCLCEGGLPAFVTQYNEIATKIGSKATMLGTDVNGGITHLDSFCPELGFLDEKGFYNIGQTPKLWEMMKRLGAKLPKDPEAHAKYFLSSWERLEAAQDGLEVNLR